LRARQARSRFMSVPTLKPARLESGDRLTQPEFHRRYVAADGIKKAELVEGVVYVASPVSSQHARPHGCMVTWLGTYQTCHPESQMDDNVTVILDADNEVQPDVCLWREEPTGPRLNSNGYIEGAPQLIVEVAVSSASYDLHDKLRAYRRNGVREYLVWRVDDSAIDWFRLRDGAFERIEPDANGIIESTTFPGLRLSVSNMLEGKLAEVLAQLD
jgi:Uma2 family endonuclease